MIVSKPDLLKYLRDKTLKFYPEIDIEQSVDQVSINLRLGRKFTTFKPLPDHFSAIRIKQSLWKSESSQSLWDEYEGDSYKLEPGKLVLAQTLERVTIPHDLMGFVEGRSSWARIGVTIHITAPKIDPGFEGTITLEMINLGRATVELIAKEDQPAQLILMKISSPLKQDEVYGSNPHDIFQYQESPIPKK